MDITILLTFLVYLTFMLYLGVRGFRQTENISDYILGGRKVGPAVTAISAGASDMSGWLLMGLPGALYVSGFVEAWIAIGLTIGAYLNWLFVAKRLRSYSVICDDSLTLPDYLSNRFEDATGLLRIVSAIVILVFFAIYVAAGMSAGAKLFNNVLGVRYELALIIGAVVIISYTFLGGYLAVCWTDFIQGILMALALVVVPILGLMEVGGISEVMRLVSEQGSAQNKQLLTLIPAGTTFIGVISTMAWGLGYFGQPHILARFMGIHSHKEVGTARRIAMFWMIFALLGAIATGIVGIALFAQNPLADSEMVFVLSSRLLTHPIIAGILLAALLSAVMSTVDSQLLVTSSAVSRDIYQALVNKSATQKQLVMISRLVVAVIATVAVVIALDPTSKILSLVSYAWAGFGASFGPLIILSVFSRRITSLGALAGIVSGAVAVVMWKNLPDNATVASIQLNNIYELLPAFIISFIAILLFSNFGFKPSEDSIRKFNEMEKSL